MDRDSIELQETAKQVAKLLGDGWKYKPNDENRKYHAEIDRGGMKICLSLENKGKDWRFNVGMWGWPSYSTMERGESKTTVVWPRDIHPQQESPSIGVSVTRGAEILTREIKCRFLPHYHRVYALCQARADAAQKHEDDQREQWERVCKSHKLDPTRNSFYDVAGSTISLENRSGSLHIEGYVSENALAAILQAAKKFPRESSK